MYLGTVRVEGSAKCATLHPEALYSLLRDGHLTAGRLRDVVVARVEVDQLRGAPLGNQVRVALRVERRRGEERLLRRLDVGRATVAVALDVVDRDLPHGLAVADVESE